MRAARIKSGLTTLKELDEVVQRLPDGTFRRPRVTTRRWVDGLWVGGDDAFPYGNVHILSWEEVRCVLPALSLEQES